MYVCCHAILQQRQQTDENGIPGTHTLYVVGLSAVFMNKPVVQVMESVIKAYDMLIVQLVMLYSKTRSVI